MKDKQGRWHSLRIRPYRSSDNKVDGVIVILLDTDILKRELEESRDYAHMLLESAEQSIVAANTDGKIVVLNGATERMFEYRRSEMLGQPLASLLAAGLPPLPAAKGETYHRLDRLPILAARWKAAARTAPRSLAKSISVTSIRPESDSPWPS